MSDARLVFVRPHDGSGRLVFGDATDVPVPPTQVGLDAGFAADMATTVQLLWHANVSRGQSVPLRLRWQQGTSAVASAHTRWQNAQAITVRSALAWQSGAPTGALAATHWQASQPMGARMGAAWQRGQPLRHGLHAAWQEALRQRATLGTRWQTGQPLRAQAQARYQEAVRLRAQALTAWQNATPLRATLRHGNRAALPVRRSLALHWQNAHRPRAGASVYAPPPPPPAELCYDPATLGRLEFTEPWVAGARLVFVCLRRITGPQAAFHILPARYYMAVHSLVAHRLPDLTPVPIFDLSLSADAGSYGWTFSASAPVSAFDVLAPSSGLPAQVRFSLDGVPFVFVVDSLQRTEEFGRRSVRFAGRSVTALLARPYARELSRGNQAAQGTAQQLAQQALLFTGVSLDWGLTDWLVPAGAWSHMGTPLAAVQAIVEAAGGYLQSHRSAATLMARHPYPAHPGNLTGSPWNWSAGGVAPDVDLAPDAIITSAIERRDGPAINGVYVSGTTQGVLALVRRTGSAADQLASLVTDPLITAQEVALQRGLSVLGAAGPKHLVSIDLPVLTGAGQPGVLDVGQLVQVNASSPWRGRVRSVSVNAKMPRARQTVQIERHLETA